MTPVKITTPCSVESGSELWSNWLSFHPPAHLTTLTPPPPMLLCFREEITVCTIALKYLHNIFAFNLPFKLAASAFTRKSTLHQSLEVSWAARVPWYHHCHGALKQSHQGSSDLERSDHNPLLCASESCLSTVCSNCAEARVLSLLNFMG